MESQGLVPIEIDSFIQESDFGALGGKDCYMFCQADTCVSFKLGTDTPPQPMSFLDRGEHRYLMNLNEIEHAAGEANGI